MDDKPPCGGHTVTTLLDLMNERERLQLERITRIENIGREREKRYTERFDSQEKATDKAFESADKAITKSERAQENYNARSNEFRAAMDDQQKTFINRNEYSAMEKRLSAVELAQGKFEGSRRGVGDAWGWVIAIIVAATGVGVLLVELLKAR